MGTTGTGLVASLLILFGWTKENTTSIKFGFYFSFEDVVPELPSRTLLGIDHAVGLELLNLFFFFRVEVVLFGQASRILKNLLR